ncbi:MULTISPECIES: BON domain-containing protein [Gulbenkiania]|uniref:BON domain n=1 Tax=Gulbenkiania indica TaxID=375574 RepID=A0A0K6GU00_9NEIS|nr:MULTISPECIES: BON domain-containing protein [Gulbenkiania]CUA82216.1 BON domain [Gulbenkiania indica]
MKKLLVAASLAAATMTAVTGCAVTSGQSSMGQYVDDATITTRVKTRMAEDKTVSAMRVNVETLNGVVQLSGFAANEAEKSRAAEIARSVPDVKDVRNNIIIRTPTN